MNEGQRLLSGLNKVMDNGAFVTDHSYITRAEVVDMAVNYQPENLAGETRQSILTRIQEEPEPLSSSRYHWSLSKGSDPFVLEGRCESSGSSEQSQSKNAKTIFLQAEVCESIFFCIALI